MAWRAEDEMLLRRLEDESLVQRLFAAMAGAGPLLHPRAGGLITELRRVPGGADAVAAALVQGAPASLAPLVEGTRLAGARPELVHHLAIFHAAAAERLAPLFPERAATAWVRALAAWIALGEERTYLDRLEDALLAPADREARIPAASVALELVAALARHAEAGARTLGNVGRAALAALARVEEASALAEAPEATRRHVRAVATRHRNGAIEAALAVTEEALEEARARAASVDARRAILVQGLAVWDWTGHDAAVEHFVIERVEKLGWELYRARSWPALRALLAPFAAVIESLARRVVADPAELAYASMSAQMFVFQAELERELDQKIALAERALAVCPSHRNGRLVLAAFLCQAAQRALEAMAVFVRQPELARCEAMIERAARLYPQATELEAARSLLEAVAKRGGRTG